MLGLIAVICQGESAVDVAEFAARPIHFRPRSAISVIQPNADCWPNTRA